VKADPDVIAVIDSILAEAGDERAPVQSRCIRCDKNVFHTVTIQGWVDRLRGIRAALEAKE
jgi:hypothetical protein